MIDQFYNLGFFGPRIFTGNISNEIQNLNNKYKMTPKQICNGNCDTYAFDLADIVGGYIYETKEDSHLPAHFVVKHNNRFYDAESPTGVNVITELNIFQ